MITSSRATLALYSATGSAAHVTSVLGLQPTSSGERGQAKHKFRLKADGTYARRHYYKTSVWLYEVESDEADPEEGGSYSSLLLLAERLADKADLIGSLRPQYTTAISYFGMSDSDQAGFVWPAKVVSALAPLGCEIYGDVYLGEDRAEGAVTEKAVLHVRAGLEEEFEAAFDKAQWIVLSMPGCREVTLSRGVEHQGQYLLLIRWDSVEDHEVGFRQSPEYLEWKALLHHFYEPFPTVEHYVEVSRATDF